MISGEVIEGRPFISSFVLVPRLSVGDQVHFLVDTGADTTVLQARDALRLGIHYEEDFTGQTPVTSLGIGGAAEEYVEPGFVLMRHDDGTVERLLLPLHFAIPTDANTRYPSVLGRDVISYFRLVFDQRAGVVTLDASRA